MYRAFGDFSFNLDRVALVLEALGGLDAGTYRIMNIAAFDQTTPRIMAANLLVPFIIASVEDFFRSAYVALLRYSDKREDIVENAKIKGEELVAIDRSQLTVPEAIAKWMSFQDLTQIDRAFKNLNRNYDVAGILRRPYRRRRESAYALLDRLISQRHASIHQARIDPAYSPEVLRRDVTLTRRAIWRVYQLFVNEEHWEPVDLAEF